MTLPQLRKAGDLLADLHGQHQHQSLLRADGQREALDRFAEASEQAARVAGAAGRLRSLILDMTALRESERENAAGESHGMYLGGRLGSGLRNGS